ncbi:hypothetical protein [Terrabacter sp. 2TAF16]|uniref:hypothetical protein n=1 Tax=Terrabacter sp. 2TAF16 TaxID=3233008 RepID=UPI003F9D92BB
MSREVPSDLRNELRSKLLGTFDGLLLYGSWARGDQDTESDLDVLALNYSGLMAAPDGSVSVGYYSEFELLEASRTLFGYHLARDGQILADSSGRFESLLRQIEPPPTGSVLGRIRSLSPVLDVSPADRTNFIEGLTQVARYLLRSALYAKALDQGTPCFSVREISRRMSDPSLTSILSSHKAVRPEASESAFQDLVERLSDVVGELQANPYGDLYALIEHTWDSDRDLSNIGALALSNEQDDLPYDELPKVIL